MGIYFDILITLQIYFSRRYFIEILLYWVLNTAYSYFKVMK